MSYSVKWLVPAASDIQAWMNQSVLNGAAQIDGAGNSTIASVLSDVVERIRGACRNSGRIPVSATAGSVPPEALAHCKVLTVAGLLGSAPGMDSYASSDNFKTQVKQANDWIELARSEGTNFTAPTDPDQSWTGGTDWGDYSGTEVGNAPAINYDLTSDGV